MRLTRRSLVIAMLLAAAAPALANPPPEGGGSPAEEKEVARSVELKGLVFPTFTESGKLKNYIFVDARMRVADSKDPWKYREQAHFIRDAITRASHRVSFNVKGDYAKLDEAIASRECLKAANEIMGEQGALVAMTFQQVASRSK